jgi:molecular chaperone GrpE (heat shock protein)
MAISNPSSFWERGRSAYLNALEEEAAQKLDALREKLKSETQPEARARLEAEIESVRKEFAEKRRKARHGLFSRR